MMQTSSIDNWRLTRKSFYIIVMMIIIMVEQCNNIVIFCFRLWEKDCD